MTLQDVLDSDSASKLGDAAQQAVEVATNVGKASLVSKAMSKVKQMWDESDMDGGGPNASDVVDSSLNDSSGLMNQSLSESSKNFVGFVGKSQV